ncbi:hypothetical protein AB0G85_38000 [Streptomyces sioyaensis]|uniref:hypothetical protein n=1 Tax=Streptomyces sioyaensis TaxID=67364 RepID=UPI0033D7EFC8
MEQMEHITGLDLAVEELEPMEAPSVFGSIAGGLFGYGAGAAVGSVAIIGGILLT